MFGDPPDLIAPEPPEDPPFCDGCGLYGHELHDCNDPYNCPGSFQTGTFNSVGLLECPHCYTCFIGTTVPMHEEQ